MTVTTEELGSARVIRWDNQRHRNAWGGATIAAIADALDRPPRTPPSAASSRAARARTSPPATTCSRPPTADAASFAATIDEFQRLTRVVLDSPVPVIAAIDGVCIGGALEFAASCDLRVGTDRARFATPEVRIGLGASNAGTLLLPEVLGESAARELLLTGALKDAAWMDRHGFFNALVPADGLDAAVAELAAAFDATTAPAVTRTKRMLNERFGDLLPAAMERETLTCVELFDTPEAQEAVQRFARRD